jgi:murein L,D-transpeptidase YcbB/YkuD
MLRANGINVAVPLSGKFVMVNIPSYELIAFEDGTPVFRSRVVVGQPATRTPELISPMTAIKFNPSWTPTPSMIRNEAAVYIPPGPYNPLGRMMLDLDNDQFIYLHDTNQKGLFKREKRALSHGCIRVEQVRRLAAWALGVTEAEIGKMIARGTTYSVPLPQDIPVFLVYYTRFPDEHDRMTSYPDIYANWEAEERAYLERAAARRAAIRAAATRPVVKPPEGDTPQPGVTVPTPPADPAPTPAPPAAAPPAGPVSAAPDAPAPATGD